MKLSTLLCFAGLSFALPSLESAKRFELNLTWDTRAPDGVERKQALINGQFPGPPLLMDEGDKVEVTVNNYLPYNTTIHYHGLE
jgi:FtsP/CotA-like multicopper oxidase with cupredoxin domain